MLKEKYCTLFNFFKKLSSDMNLNNLSEEDVVKEYKKYGDFEGLDVIFEEIQEVRKNISKYWREIGVASNMNFESEKGALKWLDYIDELLLYGEKYGELFNFLVGSFIEMSYDDTLTDEASVRAYEEAAVKEYVDRHKKFGRLEELKYVIEEAEEVRDQISKYWEKISIDTNIYLKNEQEALKWLNKIIELLKK